MASPGPGLATPAGAGALLLFSGEFQAEGVADGTGGGHDPGAAHYGGDRHERSLDLLQRHTDLRRGADVEQVRGGRGVHGHQSRDACQQVRLLIQPGPLERVERHLEQRLEDGSVRFGDGGDAARACLLLGHFRAPCLAVAVPYVSRRLQPAPVGIARRG